MYYKIELNMVRVSVQFRLGPELMTT